jgi:hypothetical protein
MARRLLRGLREAFSVNITGRLLLENQTIAALSALVTRLSPNAVNLPTEPPAVETLNGAAAGESPLMESFRKGTIDARQMIALIEQGSVI